MTCGAFGRCGIRETQISNEGSKGDRKHYPSVVCHEQKPINLDQLAAIQERGHNSYMMKKL